MLNNISDNNKKDLLQSPLSDTLGMSNVRFINKNTFSDSYSQNLYIDKTDISDTALRLYERDNDIRKFTQLAMSDMDDLSYMDLMEQLFSEGVSDPFDDKTITELSANRDLWDDLGL